MEMEVQVRATTGPVARVSLGKLMHKCLKSSIGGQVLKCEIFQGLYIFERFYGGQRVTPSELGQRKALSFTFALTLP